MLPCTVCEYLSSTALSLPALPRPPARPTRRAPQVSHAEGAGAAAALVYDDVLEPLILMGKDRGAHRPDPGIPAAFVSLRAGAMMRRLLVEGKTVSARALRCDAMRLEGQGCGCWGSILVW